MKPLLFLGGFFLLFVFGGCVRVITGIIPETEAKLVLWSEIRVGESFDAYVSQTYALETALPDSIGIVNAQVSIWEGSQLIAMLRHLEGGKYVGPDSVLAEDKKTYRIEVSASGFANISAETDLMPLQPQIAQISWLDSVLSPDRFNPQLSAGNLSFRLETQNVYGYRVQLFSYLNDQQKLTDTWFLDITEGGPNPCEKIATTTTILNTTTCPEWALGVLTSGPAERFGPNLAFDSLRLTIFPISEPVYQYFRQADSQPEGLDRAFWEPAPQYSNVQNGYGLVWLTYPRKLTIVLN
ncbi:MAG: DUF4249 family protein [Bacteroidia bacterium]